MKPSISYRILRPLLVDAVECIDGADYPVGKHALYLAQIFENSMESIEGCNEQEFAAIAKTGCTQDLSGL